MALLVGGEVRGQHLGALVLVDPADADDVGTLPQPQQLAAGPAGALGVAHTEAEHDLGALRHRVHPLDEGALGRRVEAEGVGVSRRCRGRPGRYSAGSSCAAGWNTAGTSTLPMVATVGW